MLGGRRGEAIADEEEEAVGEGPEQFRPAQFEPEVAQRVKSGLNRILLPEPLHADARCAGTTSSRAIETRVGFYSLL